jgi:hypothetical protein
MWLFSWERARLQREADRYATALLELAGRF